VEGKMATMKTEIMAEIRVKMDESNHKVKDTLKSILGLVQGLAGSQNTGNAS
jgi:hypothetical protein